MSNGITDKLINLFKKDEEPLIKEEPSLEQSLLDEWKSTDYMKTYPDMDPYTRYNYGYDEVKYKMLGEDIDVDRVMLNLIPIVISRSKKTGEIHRQKLHRRFKRIQQDIQGVLPMRDSKGHTKEDWDKIEGIMYGKYESYGDFKKGLQEIRRMEDER